MPSADYDLASTALGHKPRAKKALKEMHIREMHDGSYHVMRHHGDRPVKEGSAADLDQVHDAIEEHMGGD